MILQGRIKEISAVVPKNVVINEDNPNFSKKHKLIFTKTTGIKQLHLCDNDKINNISMAIEACKPLVLSNINMIICVTQTPEVTIPGLSHLIQNHFNLKCGCIDINGACNGFIQGLMVAYSLASKDIRTLLVFSENLSSIQDKLNKNSLMFGDGAVAMTVEYSNIYSIFKIYSDGSRFKAVWKPSEYLLMDGEVVMDFVMNEVFESLKGFDFNEFDYFVPHQSNLFILKQLQRRLNIPDEKIVINIQKYGNTSAVSIPLAMVTEIPTGKLLTCGYGAGLNWGTCEFDFNPVKTFYYEF